MFYVKRTIREKFLKSLVPNKVLLLLGARRVGKTEFLNHLVTDLKESILLLNGEDLQTVDLLKERSIANYKRVLDAYDILIIDEAQKVPDIGNILKLIVDEIKSIKIIATGSSAFDLSNKVGEPLTGRQITFRLFPIAQMELSPKESHIQTMADLEERLVFGTYPELLQINNREDKMTYLNNLISSYLYRDILEHENLKKANKLIDLLRLIAFQVGQEVSLENTAKTLGISKNTVERYLDLLSKVFVIYELRGFSRSLKSEITKMSKWYFFDNGIRNALIASFNPLNLRNDIGQLWENYLFAERIKFQTYTNLYSNNYFWRTYEQQEIDWVEEREGNLFGFELKWKGKTSQKPPPKWIKTYPEAHFKLIDSSNYLDWILPG